MNLQQVAKDLLSALEADKDYERLYGELRLAYSVAGGKLNCSQVDLLAIKRFCVVVGVSNANELLREATGLARQHHHAVRESLSAETIESCFSKAVTCVTALDVGTITGGGGVGGGRTYKKQAPQGVLSREGFIICIALIAQKWRSLRRQAAIMTSSPLSKAGSPVMSTPTNGTATDDFDDEDDDALALAATVVGGGGVATTTLHGTLSSTVAGDMSNTVTLRNPGLGNTVSSTGTDDFPARKRALIVIDSALRLFADSNLRPYLREVVRINLTEQHIFHREVNYVNNAAVGRVLWFYSEGLETVFARYSKQSTTTATTSSSSSESKLMTQKLFAAFCDEFTICPNHLSLVEAIAAFEEVQACELSQSRSKQGSGGGAKRRSTIFSSRGASDGISIHGFFELVARLSQLMYCTSRPAEALVDKGGVGRDEDGKAPQQDRLESVVNESLVDNLATKVDAFIHRVIAASFITVFDQVLPVVVGQGQTGYSPQAPPPLVVVAEPSQVCTTTSQPNPQPDPLIEQSRSNFDNRPQPSFGGPSFSNSDMADGVPSSTPLSPYSPGGGRRSVSSSAATLVRLSGFDFGSLNDGVWIYDSCTEAIRHMPQQSLQQQYQQAHDERHGLDDGDEDGDDVSAAGGRGDAEEGAIEAAYFHVNFKSVAAEIAWDRCVIALLTNHQSNEGDEGHNAPMKGAGQQVPLSAQASFFHDVRLVAANTIDDLPFASVKTGLLTYRHQHSEVQLYDGTRDSIAHVFSQGCARMAFNPHKMYLFCFEFILARYHICNIGEMNRKSLFHEPFEAPTLAHNGDTTTVVNAADAAASASIQPALTVMESTMVRVESDSDILYNLFHRLCTRSSDDLTGKGYLTILAFTELLVRIALSHTHVTSEEGLNDAITRLLLPCIITNDDNNPLVDGSDNNNNFSGEFPTEGALSSLNHRGGGGNNTNNSNASFSSNNQKTTQQRIIAGNSIIDTLVTHSTNTGSRMNDTLFKQNKALSAQVDALKEERRMMRAQQADSIAGMHQIKTFIEMMIPTVNANETSSSSPRKQQSGTSPLSTKPKGVVDWGSKMGGGGKGGVEEEVSAINPNSLTTPLKLQSAFRKELLEKYEGILGRMCRSASILTLEEELVEAAARKRAKAIKRSEAKSKAIKAREAAGHTSPLFENTDDEKDNSDEDDDDDRPTSASPVFSFSAAAGTDFQHQPSQIAQPPGNIVALTADSYQVNFQKLREEVENFMMDVNNKFNNPSSYGGGGGGGGGGGALTRRESFMPQSFSRRQSMVPALSSSGFDNNNNPLPRGGIDGGSVGAASPLRQPPVVSSNDPRMGDSTNGAFSPSFGPGVGTTNTPPPTTASKHQQYLKNPYMTEKEKKLLRDAGTTAEEEQLRQDKRVLQGQADVLAAKLQETKALNTIDSMRLNNELEIREREIVAATTKQRETVASALELQDRIAHISKINSGLSSDLTASNKHVSELLAEVRLLRAKVNDAELQDDASMLRDKVSLEKSLSLAASRSSINKVGGGVRSAAATTRTIVRAKTAASKLVSKKGSGGSTKSSASNNDMPSTTSTTAITRRTTTTGGSIFTNTIGVAAADGMVSTPRGSTNTTISTDANTTSPSATNKQPHQTLSQRLAESRIARDVALGSGNVSRVPTGVSYITNTALTSSSSRHPSVSGEVSHDGQHPLPSTSSAGQGGRGSSVISRVHSELQSTLLFTSKKDAANSECQTDVTGNDLNQVWDGTLLLSQEVKVSGCTSSLHEDGNVVEGSELASQPTIPAPPTHMHMAPNAVGSDEPIVNPSGAPQTSQQSLNTHGSAENTTTKTAEELSSPTTAPSAMSLLLSGLPSPTSPASPTSSGPSPRGGVPQLPVSLQKVPSASSAHIVASLRTRSESMRRNRGAVSATADLSASSNAIQDHLARSSSNPLRNKANIVSNATRLIRGDFEAMREGILYDLGRFGQIFNLDVSSVQVSGNDEESGSTTDRHTNPAFHLLEALIQAMDAAPPADVNYGLSPPRTAPQLRRDTSNFLRSRPQSGREASSGGEYDSTTFLTSTNSLGRVESMGRRQRGSSINRVVTASGRTSLSQAQAGGSSTSHFAPNEPPARLAFKSSLHNSSSHHHEGTPSPRQRSPSGDLAFMNNMESGVPQDQDQSSSTNGRHPHRVSDTSVDESVFYSHRQVDSNANDEGNHQSPADVHEGVGAVPHQTTTTSRLIQQPPSQSSGHPDPVPEATHHHQQEEVDGGVPTTEPTLTTTNHHIPRMPTSLPLERHTSVDMAYSQSIVGANLPTRSSVSGVSGGVVPSGALSGGAAPTLEQGNTESGGDKLGDGTVASTTFETPAYKKKMKMIENMVGRKDSMGGGARYVGSTAAQLRAQNTEMVPSNGYPQASSHAASRTQSTNLIPPRPPTGNGLVGMDRTARYIASTRPYTGTPSRPNTAQSIPTASDSIVDGGLEGSIILSGGGDAWSRPNTATDEAGRRRHSSGVAGFTHNGVPPRHITTTANTTSRMPRVGSGDHIDQLTSPFAQQFGSGSSLNSVPRPVPTSAETAAKKTIIAEAMLQGVLHMSRELQHERASNRIVGGDENLVNYTISVTDATTGASMVFSREEYARMLAQAIILANEAEFEQRKSPISNETRTQQLATSENLRRRSVREATRLMTYDDEEIEQQERHEAKRLRVLQQAKDEVPITARPPPAVRSSEDGVVGPVAATTARSQVSRGQALISSRLGDL